MAREHKGKLALDSLLIMPVQRIPRYELLIKVCIRSLIFTSLTVHQVVLLVTIIYGGTPKLFYRV